MWLFPISFPNYIIYACGELHGGDAGKVDTQLPVFGGLVQQVLALEIRCVLSMQVVNGGSLDFIDTRGVRSALWIRR